MVSSAHDEQVAKLLGDPRKVDKELATFRSDALLLSARQSELLRRYAGKWIAIHDGEVRVEASSLNALIEQMKQLRIPRGRAVVRFISNKPRKMIL